MLLTGEVGPDGRPGLLFAPGAPSEFQTRALLGEEVSGFKGSSFKHS